MGLQELVDTSHLDDDESLEENKDDEDEKVTGLDIDYTPNSASLSRDDKLCPSCCRLAERVSRRSWECNNDRCGTLNFTRGFLEYQSIGMDPDYEFLYSVNWRNFP